MGVELKRKLRKAANKEGGHAQVAISYTTGPVFTDEYYVEYAKRIADAGADSICIKDMAALLTPTRTESLVKAPMPGTVVNVVVSAGQAVKAGDDLVFIEAMKMETPVKAPQDGTVATVDVAKGESVDSGKVLVTLN